MLQIIYMLVYYKIHLVQIANTLRIKKITIPYIPCKVIWNYSFTHPALLILNTERSSS